MCPQSGGRSIRYQGEGTCHDVHMASVGLAQTIDRKIHFFEVIPDPEDAMIELPTLVSRVEELPWTTDSRRYWTQTSGDAIGLWTHGADMSRFSLATVRRSSLPRAEQNGRLTDLVLAAGAGLHEPIHIRVFDSGLVGVEFNFYGPRPSRLPFYLNHALPGTPRFTLEPLLRRDIQQRLAQFNELRLFSLQVRRSYIARIAEQNQSLGAALNGIGEASGAEVVGVVLRPEKRGRTPLSIAWTRVTRRLAGLTDLREHALEFEVKGVNASTDKVETLDLLEDQLISDEAVLTLGATSRAVEPESAFAAIERAYQELEPELLTARSLPPETAQDDDPDH